MEKGLKQYLYYRVPEEVKSNEHGQKLLYPLNVIKEKFPDLYEVHVKKYNNESDPNRKNIPDTVIPGLNVTWGDVVQLSPIHPKEIMKALRDAGFNKPKVWKYYQIDPEVLKSENTTIFLFKDTVDDEHPENYTDLTMLKEVGSLPQKTEAYYKAEFNKGEHPYLFMHVPHVFHKGHIEQDVREIPVISVSLDGRGEILCEEEK